MANLLYARPSDNVTALATITASAADASYPATNLADLDPAKPAKLTTTTGNWVFDFTSAQRVDVVAILHHNLTAGLLVKIQGNATNVWTSPTFDQAITIPAYAEDLFPGNPFLDLTGLAGYSTGGFRYWRLLISGTNAANVAIGEMVFASLKRQLAVNFAPGAETTDLHPTIRHATAFGVARVYDLGVRRRRIKGSFPTRTEADFTAVQSLYRDARGSVKPFLVVLDPAVNDALFVRFGEDVGVRTLQLPGVYQIPFVFEELSRGLPL